MAVMVHGAAHRLAQQKFGGLLTVVQDEVTVGLTVTEVASGDPERVSLLLVNLSANTMFIGPDTRVSSNRGLALEPNGGAFAVDAENDGILSTVAWFAIANLSAGTLFRVSQSRIGVVEV